MSSYACPIYRCIDVSIPPSLTRTSWFNFFLRYFKFNSTNNGSICMGPDWAAIQTRTKTNRIYRMAVSLYLQCWGRIDHTHCTRVANNEVMINATRLRRIQNENKTHHLRRMCCCFLKGLIPDAVSTYKFVQMHTNTCFKLLVPYLR